MVRKRFTTLLLPATALALGACTAFGSDRPGEETAGLEPGSPCPRPEPVAHSPGSVINLTEAPTPCRIVFRETGVVLRSDPDGSHPDPGRHIVRDSKGRFYTSGASGFPFDIAMWDTDGTFLRSFGGQGDGPGEMGSEGGLILQIDSRDRLHVKDARRVWTTFDANQTFIRRGSSRELGEAAFFGGDRILDDGGAVAGGGYFFTESSFHFRLVDSTGVVVSQFSPKDPVVYESFPFTSRKIAYGGGNTFWAGPPTYNGYSPDGYTLEEWTVDGEHVRTFRRDVPWLPTSWPPPPPPIDHRPVDEKPSPPAIMRLHMDDDGVLLVVVLSPTDRWVGDILEMMALPEEEQALMYETRMEAIDTRASVVLASELLVGMERKQVGELLTRSRLSATMTEENLLPVVRILEYDLVTQ